MIDKSNGLHILGRFYTDGKNLNLSSIVKKQISIAIRNSQLTEVGSFFHTFPGGDFTGVVCLAESHIAIHTWPELGQATIDVYTCNYSKNNNLACETVFNEICSFFEPSKIRKKVIKR